MTALDERQAQGTSARTGTPRSSHAGWAPAADRRHPVDLLEDQNTDREPDLVPVRRGRMMVSPFTFYRGAARIMAEDLKDTPSPASASSCAATPTCRTSGCSARRSAGWCSTSTTSTRPCPGRSSGT